MVSNLPFDICDQDIEPVWQSFDGWQSSLDNINTYRDLPKLAQNYIENLESQLMVPFSMISHWSGAQEIDRTLTYQGSAKMPE